MYSAAGCRMLDQLGGNPPMSINTRQLFIQRAGHYSEKTAGNDQNCCMVPFIDAEARVRQSSTANRPRWCVRRCRTCCTSLDQSVGMGGSE